MQKVSTRWHGAWWREARRRSPGRSTRRGAIATRGWWHVDAEVILHSPTPPAGFSVVAEAGALPGYPHRERIANPFPERAEFGPRQRAGSTKRVDARPPERLVRVDVPDSGGRALIQEGSLDGSAPSGEDAFE